MSQSSEQRSSLFLLDNNDRWSSFLTNSSPCLSFPRSVNVESSKDDGANGDMSMPDQFLWPWRDLSIVSEYEWVSIGWEWKEDVCLGNNVDGSWSCSIPLSNIRSMSSILKIIGLFDSKETREREKSIGIDVNEEFYLSTRRWLEPSPQVLIGEFDGCRSDRRYGCFRKRVDQYPIRQISPFDPIYRDATLLNLDQQERSRIWNCCVMSIDSMFITVDFVVRMIQRRIDMDGPNRNRDEWMTENIDLFSPSDRIESSWIDVCGEVFVDVHDESYVMHWPSFVIRSALSPLCPNDFFDRFRMSFELVSSFQDWNELRSSLQLGRTISIEFLLEQFVEALTLDRWRNVDRHRSSKEKVYSSNHLCPSIDLPSFRPRRTQTKALIVSSRRRYDPEEKNAKDQRGIDLERERTHFLGVATDRFLLIIRLELGHLLRRICSSSHVDKGTRVRATMHFQDETHLFTWRWIELRRENRRRNVSSSTVFIGVHSTLMHIFLFNRLCYVGECDEGKWSSRWRCDISLSLSDDLTIWRPMNDLFRFHFEILRKQREYFPNWASRIFFDNFGIFVWIDSD